MGRIKCPICGAETAKIVWKPPVEKDEYNNWINPTLSEKEEKDLEDKKIWVIYDMFVCGGLPKRHCYNCDKDVCQEADPLDIMETTRIHFEIGGFHEGFQIIDIINEDGNCKVIYEERPEIDYIEKIIDADEYIKIVEKIFGAYIREWKKHYRNDDICDGTSWSLDIYRGDEAFRSYGGSNAYPPNFSRLISRINSLGFSKLRIDNTIGCSEIKM